VGSREAPGCFEEWGRSGGVENSGTELVDRKDEQVEERGSDLSSEVLDVGGEWALGQSAARAVLRRPTGAV
jgi:hypothetical protein